ncbi:hypothetical protein E3P92_02586 [Wallemia ichthyophaga]|uniref:Septation protein imp2 n=1 Tax=Wallemia ichthyophaga TaxID=245174 RepID=A0A4T0E9H2_WALIC|nr:hypothetical protein E3P91_03009 [Wallemia ichthyophaga]TIA81015.1 hypothetical protein E3P98_02342 [Wallemia ichthyophaga]TIA90244.1 hypothetical protein E3P97_02664 [Wallemia ichthyophaga]TIB10147.1 hypothetical protein E3P90_02977 [Wallemia ichthyophaga]TIB12460.1 hypothetical protein E3P92_02586 [Wallemia ichthyophaga]
MISAALQRSKFSLNLQPFKRLYSNKQTVPQKTTHDEQIKEHRESGLTTPHPPKDVLTAEVISGAPETLQHRQVRIYKPTKNTMQSGTHNTHHWRVDFDILQGGGRWEHPLMGWSSSADHMQGTNVKFQSKEDAINFCEKQGWDYFVSKPRSPKFKTKQYAANYYHYSNGYGFDTLTNKLKSSSKTVDDLKLFWKERSAIEDEYARKMAKLSRFLVGTGETGAVRDSLDTLSTELEQTSQNHFNLCQTIHRDLERPTNEWSIRLSNLKKSSLATIEKKYKVLQTQESYVDKAKAKYTDNCVSINTFTAQKSLLQGKDLDRVDVKLEKAKSVVGANERDYQNFVKALSDTRKRWEADWRMFCDLCQDEEEERIEFLKSNMWSYANEVSTVCVADDESCEKLRQSLEQVDPELDVEFFVDESMTGNILPNQPTFIDFSRETQVPSPAPRYATFHRNSIRPLDMPRDSHRPLQSHNQPPKHEVLDHPPPSSPKKQVVQEEPKLQKSQPKESSHDENAPFKVPQLPARNIDRPPPTKVEPPSFDTASAPQTAPKFDEAPPRPEKEDKVETKKESGDVDELAAALAQLRNAPPATGNLRANVAAQAEKKPRSRPVSQHSAVSPGPQVGAPAGQQVAPTKTQQQPQRPPFNPQNPIYQGMDASQIQALQIQHKYAPHTTPPFPAMMQRPTSSQSNAGGPVEDVMTTYHQQLPHERSHRNSRLDQTQQTQQHISRPPSSTGRSPSREGFAGIGAGGGFGASYGSRQPSPAVSNASPVRAATPLGISLNASGEVAHDQKAEEYRKRRSVSPALAPAPSATPAPANTLANQQQQMQMQQQHQAQAYYQYQMMMAQQAQQGQGQGQQQQPQHPYQPYQYYPYGQPQQQPYVMTTTPGPGYNPYPPSSTPAPAPTPAPSGPIMNAQQQHRAPSPSPTPIYNGTPGPHQHQQNQQTPFIPQIQTQQLSHTPQIHSATNTSMYRQHSPSPLASPSKEPILFHVKALYDYAAQTTEEFDFKAGDVIAVTKTPEDGWWTGQLTDEARCLPGKTLFPSNFVSLF